MNWPTPKQQNSQGAGMHGEGGMVLQTTVGLLAPGIPSTNGKSQELWRTPSASEAGAKVETLFTKDGKPAKPGQRAFRKTPAGKIVLQSQTINQQVEMVQAKGKLNPNWVEQLMGLPVGWTNLNQE